MSGGATENVGDARIVIREGSSAVARDVAPGDTVTIGQRAGLRVGVEPRDPGVSGLALTVEVGADGWAVTFANRNGCVLQRWASAPEWVRSPATRELTGSRVGIRVVGLDNVAPHWVLLERDRTDDPSEDGDVHGAYQTQTLTRPNALTPLQLATVHAVFADHLAWPPMADPVPRSLDSARRRLGAGSESAVKDRLIAVRARAQALGFDRRVGLTDPAYVFLLAEHGYLSPPSHQIPADDPGSAPG